MKRFVWLWLTILAASADLKAQDTLWSNKICSPLRQVSINSPFGFRVHPVTGQPAFHNGVDLAARSDTVFCIMDGMVLRAAYDPYLGFYIKIFHSGDICSVYGHLSHLFVAEGETIVSGQPLGISGSTGRVTGEHLHFSLVFQGRYCNPLKLLFMVFQGANYSTYDPIKTIY